MSIEAVLSAPEPMTPLWWLERLYSELMGRQREINFWHRYSIGDPQNPDVEQRMSRAMRRLMKLSKTNVTGLIVEATAERLEVGGFRFGDNPEADDDAWRIWQHSDFDAESELAMTAALRHGRSFVLVEPSDGPGLPRLYAEDARQMIVAYRSGSRTERLAALKVWVDEWTGETHATLYLPDSIHRFRTKGPRQGTGLVRRGEWFPRVSGLGQDDSDASNPLGTVPVFELRNRPALHGAVLAEHADVIPDQNKLNYIAFNTLVALEYGAFRQKWATGIEIPRDANGNAMEPFNVAINRLLMAEDPDSKFGDFAATDIAPYIELYKAGVQHMAAVSRTPASYMLGGLINLSAEALAAAEAGLVKKVQRRQRHFEQAFESAIRLAFRSMGDERAEAEKAETVWKSAEIKSDAQQMDAAVKGVSGHVITAQTAQEIYLGMSTPQRARDEAYRQENDVMSQFQSLLTQQAAPLLGEEGEEPTP